MSLDDLVKNFNSLFSLKMVESEWNLIKNNIETLEDIKLFIMIIRGEKNEKKANKNFSVMVNTLFLESDSKLQFDDYMALINSYSKDFSKKDIFMNTRLILTGNVNGPSVKELFNFFGIQALLEKANVS